MSDAPDLDFIKRAHARPDRAALADDLGASMTHGELAGRSLALAAGLRALLGAEKRTVCVAADNHGEHVVAILGIFLSGHVWAPLNPKAAPAFNAGVIDRLKPALVLLDAACAQAVSPEALQGIDIVRFGGGDPAGLDAVGADPAGFVPAGDPDAVMSIKLTGGTTGSPKGVAQTRRMIATAARDLQATFMIEETDVNLAVAPLSHGAFHLLLPVLAAGGRHEIVSRAEPDEVLDLMEARAVSLAFMPPTLIVKLMERPGARPDRFPALREMIYSAAPMPPAQIERAWRAFGTKIAVMYGQVEAPVAIAAMNAKTMAETGKLDSVGRPCPSTELRIDDAGESGTGEILARGPLAAEGYVTGEPFPAENGWLRTGDLGALDDEGYLFIKGRLKEMIISGGFNIYPAEVERALLAHPGVEEACVFGVADDYWGERVEAAVVLREPVEQDALTGTVRAAIGAAAVPKAIHRLDALPRNPVGKVVRREVRERLSAT